MALLAEELVEEWLNRQGYFTIRGARGGNYEMDLLAIRPGPEGIECRHLEVQASLSPLCYISKMTEADARRLKRRATSAALRPPDVVQNGVRAYIERKFEQEDTVTLREKLAPGPWSRELVVNVVRHPNELDTFRELGVRVRHLGDVLQELAQPSPLMKGAVGRDLLELVWLGKLAAPVPPAPEAVSEDDPE